MFSKPAFFQEFLQKNDYINEVYDAMKNDDLAEAVIISREILERNQNLAPLDNFSKSSETSEKYRLSGNKAFKNSNFQHSLMFYNRALVHAPNKSKELKLAYSNRSALFFKMKVYKPCLRDIETCLVSDCPAQIIDKLRKRKETVIRFIETEKLPLSAFNKTIEIDINSDITSHSQVPCASTAVEFVGSVWPKVLASKDIKVGTVVACEKAYMSYTVTHNALFACHYCQRQSLNLTPCNNCCVTLFCDEDCKTKCYNEYHKYECYLMGVLKMICTTAKSNLMIKTLFKLRAACNTWEEFIRESQCMGLDRLKISSVENIFDCNRPFSALCLKDDRPFIHGAFYNGSFVCGALLHYIEDIPEFYPTDSNQKQEAVRAISRIMVFLFIHLVSQPTFQVVTDLHDDKIHVNNIQNYGTYSFTGKLKISCKPNIFIIYKNSELILLAIQTIKSGEELTISTQQHWLITDCVRQKRNINGYLCSGSVCDCPICSGNGSLRCKGQLSNSQLEFYRDLNFVDIDSKLSSTNLTKIYNYLLEILDVLRDVPYSEEYAEIFKRFRKCIICFEINKGNNFVLNRILK